MDLSLSDFEVFTLHGGTQGFTMPLYKSETEGSGVRDFTVTGTITTHGLNNGHLHITPDDCVHSIKINDKLVDLSAISKNDLCDFHAGFELDATAYLNSGPNKIALELSNTAGPFGLNIRAGGTHALASTFEALRGIAFLICALIAAFALTGYLRGQKLFRRMSRAHYRSPYGKQLTAGMLLLVTALGYCSYFRNYAYPPAVFWDENYHVASAQKYLNEVHFMENHPPLGKLLIALGEKLVKANDSTTQSIDTDYATNFPAGFSFAGYRLFPALLAWLCTPLFFLIALKLTRRPLRAALLSSLYIFDNALIVHCRGAMLEPTMIFFTLLILLQFLILLRSRRQVLLQMGLWGLSFGLLMTTKLLGAVMFLLIPIYLYKNKGFPVKKLAVFTAGFLITYVSIWSIHFSLGKHIRSSLTDQGYYSASPEYRKLLDNETPYSIANFPIMLRDSFRFMENYNRGVPRLNIHSPTENGSRISDWIIGARSINYRWERLGDTYRYLYLQCNPVIWLMGLLSLVYLLNWGFNVAFVAKTTMRLYRPLELGTLAALYFGCLLGLLLIPRVMYLYHYFLPLIFSLFLFSAEVGQIRFFLGRKIRPTSVTIVLALLSALIIVSYDFYSPLTYYAPITNHDMIKRSIIPAWELKCVECN